MNYLPNHLVDSDQKMSLPHLDASAAFDMEEWEARQKMVAEEALARAEELVVDWVGLRHSEACEMVAARSY